MSEEQLEYRVSGLEQVYKLARQLRLTGRDDWVLRKLDFLRPILILSGLRVSVLGYQSLIVLYLAFAWIPAIPFGFLLGPLASLFWIALYLAGFLFLLYYPKMKLSSRATALETRLPILQSYIAVSSMVGRSHEDSILRLYERSRILGFEDELGLIAHLMVTKKMSLANAFHETSKATPSTGLKMFFDALSGLVAAGRGIVDYIESQFQSTVTELETRYRSAFESLGMLVEMFMAGVILMPIILLTIVIALFGGGSSFFSPPMDPLQLIGMGIFVGVPVTAAFIYVLVDSIVSRLRP